MATAGLRHGIAMRYKQRRPPKPRTRFDVAMSHRAQRRPRRAPRLQLAALAVGMTVVLAALGLRWFDGGDWRIGDVQVQNNAGVPVESIVGASGLQGEHYLFADLDAAARAIDDLPGVEAAQVTCTWEWRTACRIAVQPARAMAVWESARGNVWSDYEGKVQRALEAVPAPLTVVVESGEPPALGERIDPRLLRALTELAAAQPAVKRYAYSPEHGLTWVNADRWRVRLGVADYDGAMSDKLKLARALRDQLVAQSIRVTVLDVRFVEAPYYVSGQ